MQKNRAIAIRSGLSWGIVLALCELGFGLAVYVLLPSITGYMKHFQIDLIIPVAIVYLAYLFLLIAVYFASGMITAKWLASQPLKSAEISMLGAFSGATAEVVRTIVAIPVNLAIALLFPIAIESYNPVLVAIGNVGIRLVCGMPVFVIFAAIVAGLSAYTFSLIFFRPEPVAQK